LAWKSLSHCSWREQDWKAGDARRSVEKVRRIMFSVKRTYGVIVTKNAGYFDLEDELVE